MDALETRAAAIGKRHGISAASWAFDGNTDQATYARVLKGIQDGDPEVTDSFREPNLSGEYADDYTSRDLASELDIDRDADAEESGLADAETAWENAAREAFWAEIERACRYQLTD